LQLSPRNVSQHIEAQRQAASYFRIGEDVSGGSMLARNVAGISGQL
jgi:hypothetical protein